MERDSDSGQTPEPAKPHTPELPREPMPGDAGSDGLLDRLSLIESQPLDRRARGFEQLHDELLQELQRSDNDGS